MLQPDSIRADAASKPIAPASWMCCTVLNSLRTTEVDYSRSGEMSQRQSSTPRNDVGSQPVTVIPTHVDIYDYRPCGQTNTR